MPGLRGRNSMSTTHSNIQTDIVIAGGGPVGLAMACSLSKTNLRIVLVDAGQESEPVDHWQLLADKADFDPRVSALTETSRNFLSSLNAWPSILATRACPYQDMSVWDGEGTGSIHFSAADIHEDCLGHIVENRLITAALFNQAKGQVNLEILSGQRVDQLVVDDKSDQFPVALTLSSGQQLQARLLIGADGARSFVREQAGYTLKQWDYGHKAIVTTVKTEMPHTFTCWQRFIHTGPLAFLPLQLPGLPRSAQQYSSIVWSCESDRADEILALDDEAFRQVLGEAFEHRLGAILEADQRFGFPLWQRHVTEYVHEGVALVGDAAHTIHPLAGQGVNLGFADVQVLAEVISRAIDRGEDYGSHQVLSRFQRQRKGPNLAMMAAMEGFKRLFGSEDLMVTWLRNVGLNLTDQVPMVKQQLMRQAMGL